MSFESPLFMIPVTVGCIFIVVGFIMLLFPPKRINPLYGYRSKNSMKSQERWDFSQKFSAKEMIKMGGLLSLFSFVGLILNLEEKLAIILGLIFMLVFVILLWARTERAIKRKFEKEESER